MGGSKIFGIFVTFLLVMTVSLAPAMMGGSSGKGHMGSGQMGTGHMGSGHMGSGHSGMMEKGGHGHGKALFTEKAFGMTLTGSIVDVKAQMERMGRQAPKGLTHHIMVTPSGEFPEGTTGKVFVTYPDGTEKEVGLMAMGNHMGADLNLSQKGEYKFRCLISSGGTEKTITFTYSVGE